MKRNSSLLFGVFGLSFILLIVVVIVSFIGNRQISSPPVENQNQATERGDRRRIRKVTVYKDDGSCLEIGSDAVVRTYKVCGENLTDIHRLADPKRVIDLMEYVSRLDTSKLKTKPTGAYIQLSIETDQGTETVYVSVTEGQESISEVIELIEGDLPQSTPTPGPTVIPTPTLPGTTPVATHTPTPTIGLFITPTPTIPGEIRTFTCGFSDDQGVKVPYYVSQIICSTEPSPAP